MEYFNGHNNTESHKVEKLTDLNQEEANGLACGPQDLFFDKLERLNADMQNIGIEKIDVTNKWNWKPGSYDKVKEYIYKRLDLHKKAKGMDSLIMRAQDRMNYMNYIQRQVRDMERERANLKYLGVGRDVDIEEFKETCRVFVDNIIEQCDKVYKMTNGKVIMTPYVEIQDRTSWFYLDVKLTELTLDIYDGYKEGEATKIQSIDLAPIHIIFKQSLRHVLNKQRTEFNSCGRYLSTGPLLLFPFIARGYRHRGQNYQGTCYDMHHDDVRKAMDPVKGHNLLALSVTLMQWAQYYHMKNANPYNQPYLTHLGMPEDFSEAYKNYFDTDSVTGSCGNSLIEFANNLGMSTQFEKDELMEKTCSNIKCSLTETCNLSIGIKQRKELRDKEHGFKSESMAIFLADYLFDAYNGDTDLMQRDISMIIGDEMYFNFNYDNQDLHRQLSVGLYEYFLRDSKFDTYLYQFLEDNKIIDKEIVPEKAVSKEELETIMKSWAASQGGE